MAWHDSGGQLLLGQPHLRRQQLLPHHHHPPIFSVSGVVDANPSNYSQKHCLERKILCLLRQSLIVVLNIAHWVLSPQLSS